MKTSRLFRSLSLALVIALLLQVMPPVAFAAENTSAAVDVADGSPGATVVGEVLELRGEDTKHFRMSDGSFTAVSYGMPVHFLDENGTWQDINNTPVMTAALDNAGAYQISNDNTASSFAATLEDGQLFTASQGDRSVSMSLLDGAEYSVLLATMNVNTDTNVEDNVSVETEVPVEVEVETETEVTTEAETEPETEAPTEAEAEPETETPTEIEAEPETEAPTEAEAEPETEAPTETEAEPETEAPTEAEAEPETEAPTETEAEPETEAPTEAETEPETEAPTEAEVESETEVATETEAEPETEAPAETEVAPETETDAEPEANAEANASTELITVIVSEDIADFNRSATAQLQSDNAVTMALSEEEDGAVEDFMPNNLRSSILYEDVYPDVDILYTAWSYHIKEEIIVHAPRDAYRFDFFLELDGLSAVLNADNSISLVDEESEEIYFIPAPYMLDSAGATSEAVTYTLTDVADGFILTVEADKTWINSEDREFPITIDPSLYSSSLASTHTASDDIYTTTVLASYPTSAFYNDSQHNLYTGFGNTGTLYPYATYMYVNNLPTVPAGCVITSSTLQMWRIDYSALGCFEMPIGLFPVTDSVPSGKTAHQWFQQMTWNTRAAYDEDEVIDFNVLSYYDAAGFVTWDLTELAKQWYAGEGNRAFALAPIGDYTSTYSAWQTFKDSDDYYCPIIYVNYRSSQGIESYYTYQTLGGGSSGAAYIADSTGQLKIVNNLTGYSSTTNPFSLNLVYNSDYFAGSTADYQPPSKLGLSMTVGSGWNLDCVQAIFPETISNTYYLKYYDGDGTVHYFKKINSSDSYYYDEDGLGLKIMILGDNAYNLSDEYGNYWLFYNNVMTQAADSDANKIDFNYTSSRLTSITQTNYQGSTVTLATLTYSGNSLSTVTDAAGKVYTLTYSGTNLASIKKNGTVIAQYGYSGYRVTKMTDTESSYALNFTYNSENKISGYYETGGSTTGARVAVTYPYRSQTTYRDYGADRTANTSDDILSNYLFDYAERTVNVYVTDASGNILGVSNAAYSGSGTTDKTNNRTLRSTSMGVPAQQLLRYTGFESGSWTHSGTSVATTKPRTGLKSVTGSTTSTSTTQYAQRSSESLTAGTTYTLSSYVYTSGMTFTGKGVYLKVTDTSGNTWTSDPVAYATSTAIDNGWVRISVSFTAKVSGAHTVAVYREGANGTFYADDFQLEKGSAPSGYNMVENGGMQMSTYGWTMGTGAGIASGTGVGTSTASLKITSTPTVYTNNAYQDIQVNLSGSRTYVLSGWVKANAAPDTVTSASDAAQDTEKQCGLRLRITYSDGSTEFHYVPFETDIETWQFVSYAIVPGSPTKTVSAIRVICAYEGNTGTAYFDDISLVQEVAQSMSYDSNGNLLSATSTGLTADVNTYYGSKLTQTVTGGSGTYTYTYGNSYFPYRVTSASNGLITQSMSYDTFGNVTTTTLSGSGSATISTTSAYDSTGNRLTSVTDAAGNKVTYAYGNANSIMTGLPTSVTDPKGTVTTTAYDSHNRITQTSIANTVELLYNYSSGNLSSVTRTTSSNSQSYNFTYDAFGNMLTLGVGSQTLGSYTYNTGNGQLKKQTYGNGDVVSYTYDTLGRVNTVTYDDGRVLTYTYTGEGRLYSATETGGGTTVKYLYTYDSIGRLIGSQRIDGSTTVIRTQQGYDTSNRLASQAWQLGSTTYSESFAYNSSDGSLNTHKTATGQTLTMGYDGLRRLSTVTGGVYGKTYGYRNISSSQTTTQVASLKYDLPTDLSYSYTYDANGNIATYAAPGRGTVTYTYDAQGQLTKATGDGTYTYTYDAAGNLLTANGHTYTYGNSSWKDLLTAYDSQSISYDNSGNPTSYYNGTRWTFTWTNGRNLTTATNGTTNLSYTYDTSGLRTSKTVDGTKHTYLYAGGNLMRETYGSNTLDFFYDSNGYPYALKYNGTTYYYITNLQGDVTRIVNASGTVVASYEYDPFGNITSSSGDLAAVNPLRYRGYYYDSETGLYYLQSRYYDPKIGRFINADGYASTGQGFLGFNMFAYCRNNPVSRIDISGTCDLECGDTDPIADELVHEDSGLGGGNNSASTGTSSSSGTTNNCLVVGGGHGNAIHKTSIDNFMAELANSGDYVEVYGNRALTTAGLNGSWRPDIIAIRADGTCEIWEFASPSQATGTYGYSALEAKLELISAANPSVTIHNIVPWEGITPR